MNEEQIKELQEKIKTAKTKKERADWELEQLEKEWKEKYGCSTMKEVNEKISKLEDEKETLENERDEHLTEIKKVLDDNEN
jgi:chromosome segregation ATPase